MLARSDVTWQPAQIHESLQIIIDESDRLTREINSLLDVSRMQLNAMQIEPSTWPIRALFEQICQRLAARAQLQQINFEIRIPDEMPDVHADRERIRVVCENLLTNALKYSPNGGIIRISARNDNGMAIVSVSDQGIGIPIDEQSKIFERFYRIDNRLRRETQGFGLGLFLAKAIIEAHHGQIWVESHAHHGSRFFFSIPLAIHRINGQSTPEYDEFIDLTKDNQND
jgi:signal transduction histidine kinase